MGDKGGTDSPAASNDDGFVEVDTADLEGGDIIEDSIEDKAMDAVPKDVPLKEVAQDVQQDTLEPEEDAEKPSPEDVATDEVPGRLAGDSEQADEGEEQFDAMADLTKVAMDVQHVAQDIGKKADEELRNLFGLEPKENLVESFKCKMLQTYACNHNSYTPAIQMAFQGVMYVTDKHMCFYVEEKGRKLPFKLQYKQITSAQRRGIGRKGAVADVLRLETANGEWMAFKDFSGGNVSLDSALALLEHLMDSTSRRE